MLAILVVLLERQQPDLEPEVEGQLVLEEAPALLEALERVDIS